MAIDSFLRVYKDRVRLVAMYYQVIVQKLDESVLYNKETFESLCAQ